MAGLHWWNWLVRDGQNGRFYSSANTRCGCGPPRRPPSRATCPARGPSACTTTPSPGRSVSPRARPGPACGTASAASFPPWLFLSLGRALRPRLRKGTFPDSAVHVRLSSITKSKCSDELANQALSKSRPEGRLFSRRELVIGYTFRVCVL